MKSLNVLKISFLLLLVAGFFVACTPTVTEEQEKEVEEKEISENESVQSDPVTTATELQKVIDAKLEQLKVKEHEAEDGPAVITIKFFYEGEQIHKIEYTAAADHGSMTEHYYFTENATLALAQLERATWSFDPENEGETIEFVDNYKFYFDGNKTIKASGKSVAANSKVFDKAMENAKEEELSSTKGDQVLARAATAKALFKEGLNEDWSGMDYLDLKEQ